MTSFIMQVIERLNINHFRVGGVDKKYKMLKTRH